MLWSSRRTHYGRAEDESAIRLRIRKIHEAGMVDIRMFPRPGSKPTMEEWQRSAGTGDPEIALS